MLSVIGCKVGKNAYYLDIMASIFSRMGIICARVMGIIHYDTCMIFCDIPIILSLIFIIHSALLSISSLVGITFSPIDIDLSVIHCIQ